MSTTPQSFIQAVKENRIRDVLRHLNDDIDIDYRDQNLNTALFHATKHENTAILELLIMRGADIDAPNSNLLTPLASAIKYGTEAAATLLAKHSGALEAQFGDMIETPLIAASNIGLRSTVEILLQRGVNIDAHDKNGNTALHHALKEKRESVINILIKYEPDPKVKNDDKETALHIAAKNSFSAAVQRLLELKADVHAKDKNGYTPLHCALKLKEGDLKKRLEIVQLLLTEKADINEQDNIDAFTPLHLAVENDHLAAVELLVKQKGINIDAKDRNGRTPFFIASLYNKNDIAALLLLHNANPNISAPSKGQKVRRNRR